MMRPLVILSALTLAISSANAQEAKHTTAQPVSATTVTRESAGTVSAPKPTGKASMPTEITLQREVFAYSSTGRRDPYKSLMSSSEVRPLLSDLRLAVVALDPDGNNSIAVLRDSYSKQQYRVRVGQQLGRLRVTAIKQKAVQFTMEEFGFNRTETLFLSSDTTKVRNP